LDKEQDVDLTVVDAQDRSEADKKISQIENIFAEE
jgi:glutaredoxin